MNKLLLILSLVTLTSGCTSKPVVRPGDLAYNPIENKKSHNNNTFRGWAGIPDFPYSGIGRPYYGLGPR